MQDHNPRAGFAWTELTVVVLLLAILAGALTPRVTDRLAVARDARRLEQVLAIREAVEQYRLDTGAYPRHGGNGGWNRTDEDELLPVLVEGGYLETPPRDPLNDSTYHYRYYVFARGAEGCAGPGEFYVLGIRSFETAEFQSRHPSEFRCTTRDWTAEFAWVTGGGTSDDLGEQ